MIRALLPRFRVMHWLCVAQHSAEPAAEGRVLRFGWGRLVIEFAVGVREVR